MRIRVRSDWNLERHLEYVRDQARSPESREAVQDALVFIRSGSEGYRRTGRELVRLLEIARLRASEESEWNVVRLLHDSLDYCEGRILEPEFEDRNRLYRDGRGRSELNTEYLAGTLRVTRIWMTEAGRRHLQDDPGCTAQGLLDHLTELGADARFVEAPADLPGRYRIVRHRAELALWLERVLRDRVDIEDPAAHAHRLATSPEAVAVLASDDKGRALMRAAELQRQAASVKALRLAIEDPLAAEDGLRRLLAANTWMFGGRFVAPAGLRRLVQGDEYDIPLVRGDGCLHVVELKRAMGARPIIKRHRAAWVPTSEVHDAAQQAINYLVGLDENRNMIKERFGIEVRRASATVLVGHPGLHPDVPEEQVNETLRTMSSHLSRIEVLTYKELLDGAERALNVG